MYVVDYGKMIVFDRKEDVPQFDWERAEYEGTPEFDDISVYRVPTGSGVDDKFFGVVNL